MSVSYKSITAYRNKNYDRMELNVPAGSKAKIKELAAAEGVSVNRFIIRCVEIATGASFELGEDLPQIAAAKIAAKNSAEQPEEKSPEE